MHELSQWLVNICQVFCSVVIKATRCICYWESIARYPWKSTDSAWRFDVSVTEVLVETKVEKWDDNALPRLSVWPRALCVSFRSSSFHSIHALLRYVHSRKGAPGFRSDLLLPACHKPLFVGSSSVYVVFPWIFWRILYENREDRVETRSTRVTNHLLLSSIATYAHCVRCILIAVHACETTSKENCSFRKLSAMPYTIRECCISAFEVCHCLYEEFSWGDYCEERNIVGCFLILTIVRAWKYFGPFVTLKEGNGDQFKDRGDNCSIVTSTWFGWENDVTMGWWTGMDGMARNGKCRGRKGGSVAGVARASTDQYFILALPAKERLLGRVFVFSIRPLCCR